MTAMPVQPHALQKYGSTGARSMRSTIFVRSRDVAPLGQLPLRVGFRLVAGPFLVAILLDQRSHRSIPLKSFDFLDGPLELRVDVEIFAPIACDLAGDGSNQCVVGAAGKMLNQDRRRWRSRRLLQEIDDFVQKRQSLIRWTSLQLNVQRAQQFRLRSEERPVGKRG